MEIGIAGLGHLGKIHLKLAGEISQLELKAVYDVNSEVLKNLPFQNDVKICDNYDDLLNTCEAVLIITPTPTHFDLASRAIKKGKHVFIEKPATDNAEDTKKLIHLAKEAGVIVQVGHVERFNPAFTAARNYIQNPFHIEIQRLATYNSRGTDVSVVLDLMIHDIDLVLTTVKSKIRKVLASGAPVVSKTSDFAHARIEFENGCIANITTNRIATQNVRHMAVYQKNNFINIDLLNKITTVHTVQPLEGNTPKGILVDTPQGQPKYEIIQNQPIIIPVNAIKTELEHFYESVVNHAPVAVPLTDAENALLVIKSIEAQINQGTDK
jgi:predicted dehydrogenase